MRYMQATGDTWYLPHLHDRDVCLLGLLWVYWVFWVYWVCWVCWAYWVYWVEEYGLLRSAGALRWVAALRFATTTLLYFHQHNAAVAVVVDVVQCTFLSCTAPSMGGCCNAWLQCLAAMPGWRRLGPSTALFSARSCMMYDTCQLT